jgi:Zn-finger protein
MDERTNGRICENGVWSCSDCILVHTSPVAEMVLDALMDGQCISDAWKIVERLL